jgi:hypothetical protein
MPSAASELLSDLAPVLGRWGRWYLFGAQAVLLYGVPRLSADVDVTVWLTPDEPERFAREMSESGFGLRVTDPAFIRRTRVMPFVHDATGMALDVVLAASGLEEAFLSRSLGMAVGSVTIPVLDVNDLVIAKVLAARPKDLDDARNLWRIHGTPAGAAMIRGLLAQLEEALGQSDLLPTFDNVSHVSAPLGVSSDSADTSPSTEEGS